MPLLPEAQDHEPVPGLVVGIIADQPVGVFIGHARGQTLECQEPQPQAGLPMEPGQMLTIEFQVRMVHARQEGALVELHGLFQVVFGLGRIACSQALPNPLLKGPGVHLHKERVQAQAALVGFHQCGQGAFPQVAEHDIQGVGAGGLGPEPGQNLLAGQTLGGSAGHE